MARPTKDIDTELLLDLLASGMSKSEVGVELGISVPTLNRRIEGIRSAESALLAYDKVHYLDLIGVKQRIIQHMDDSKLEEAPLGQLAQAYSVVTKAENLIQGRPTEIHGLMGYLMHLEKEGIVKAGVSKNDAAGGKQDEVEQLSLFGDIIDI